MNIYDVLVDALIKDADVLSMQKKFRLFEEMSSLIKTDIVFEETAHEGESNSINKTIKILDKIMNFNYKLKHKQDNNKLIIIPTLTSQQEKSIDKLTYLLVQLLINELGKDKESLLSNGLLNIALNDYAPNSVVNLIKENKDKLKIGSKFIKESWWINLDTKKLDFFEDELRKSLTLKDFEDVLNEENEKTYRSSRTKDKKVGYLWIYSLFLVSKNKEKLKLEDLNKFIGSIVKSRIEFPKYSDKVCDIVYKTLENIKENVNYEEKINIENNNLKIESLNKYYVTVESLYKIFSKKHFTKTESFILAEYLVEHKALRAKENFMEMNKNISDDLFKDYLINDVKILEKIDSFLSELNVNLTIEDLTAMALINSKKKEGDLEIILDYANKKAMNNSIKPNTNVKKRGIKF